MICRYIYILLVMIPLIFSGTVTYAMPPHPDLLKKWRDEGTYTKNINKVISSKTINRASATTLRSAPASGTVRIPVILVAYREAYDAETPLSGININPGNGDRLFLFAAAVVFMLLLLFSARLKVIKKLKPALPLYSAAMALLLSCGDAATTGYDERDFPTDASVYDNLLNSATELSVRQFYHDMSHSNLTLQFDVFGPVTVSRTWTYYGSNDSSGNDKHPGELATESIKLMISKNSGTDFSVYDNDADGEIDTVIIIHEGPGEETGAPEETIWSHQWNLYSARISGDGTGPVYTDDVWFNSYVEVPEYTESRGDSSVGVFAHEFGHVMGLPDLYDTSGDSDATNGVGDWSLMSSGSWGSDGSGNDPAPLLAWERMTAGGTGSGEWVTITTLSGTGTDKSINDIETSAEAYMVYLDQSSSGEEQYLIIEGKTGANTSSWYVPGSVSGLLITHIHNGIIADYTSTNSVNSGSSRVHGVNIVEASTLLINQPGKLWTVSSYSGSGNDLFCSTTKASLTGTGYPNTNYYTSESVSDKSGSSGVSITGISANTFPMNFDYTIP